MKANMNNDAVFRIPLEITIGQARYSGDALGKSIPHACIFTCYLNGLGMFMVERSTDPVTKKRNWVSRGPADNELLTTITQEIDRIRAA